MYRVLLVVLITFCSSRVSHSSELDFHATDTSATESSEKSKPKNKRYDASQYVDTLVINEERITMTKKEFKSDFRKYTKNAHDSIVYNGDTLTVNEARQVVVKSNRDSIRANKNIWISILGGPSFTPEASLGAAGVVLMSFKFNPKDSVVNRSTLPLGFMGSINNTFMLAGAGEFFLKQNKIQISANYGIRYEPSNYFGVGFGQIDKNHQSDTTTQYTSFNIQFKPIISFKLTEEILLGGIVDYTYYNMEDVNPVMAKNNYYLKTGNNFIAAGVGVNFRYDTRDNPTMPYQGIKLNLSSTVYGKWLGGDNDFTYTSVDYRQYQRFFNRRSVLAWNARVDVSTGDVPFTKLPTFGSPFDLRGYAVGRYRDKTMGYALLEYRHMFGSTAVYNHRRPFYSRLGFAVWGGVGSIGKHVWEWDQAKWNYGVGLRYEIQPNTNVRLDLGKSPGGKPMFYMNMTETF